MYLLTAKSSLASSTEAPTAVKAGAQALLWTQRCILGALFTSYISECLSNRCFVLKDWK